MHALLKSCNEAPISIERKLRLIEQVNPVLSNDCRRRLRYMHMRSFDWEQGGLLSTVKFIDRDSVEYSLVMATEDDRNEERMARLTLDNAMSLIDPVWGGVYQYSTQGKWDIPHYRKTMAAQAGHLRLYALAYAQLKFKHYLNTANSIQSYIKNFMTSDNGAFYTGQADNIAGINPTLYFSLNETERVMIGVPEIDKRILSKDNGWMIEALATHYEYCGSQKSLDMAITAADWINKHTRNNSGGYLAHSMTNTPLHLADTLAMARSMLQLYRASMDKKYLDYACTSANYIYQNFRNEQCGYNSKVSIKNEAFNRRQLDENIAFTRFVNLLAYYSNNKAYQKMAKHGLRYLSIPEIATSRMEEAGILLIDREMTTTPLTININGELNHPVVNEFKLIANRQPGWYKLIKFKHSDTVSASIEIDGIKSKPVTTPERLQQLLQYH
jgi:uncharacterized protein